MNALRALEFERVRQDLARYCATAESRSVIQNLEPAVTVAAINPVSTEVGEILRVLQADIPAPGGDVSDLDDVFAVLRHRGEVLEPEGLLTARDFLETAERFHRFFRTGEEAELLSRHRSPELVTPRDILTSLRTLITGDGRLNEEKVPEIAGLRRRVTDLHRELQESSDTIIRNSREMYREDRATVRDGRTVLPLVADFKGRLDGIVHEASGSGETLFVEPRELVDLNNRLARTRNDILREIRRVLRELTEQIRTLLPELDALRKNLVEADGLLARALYGFERGGRIVSTGETVQLRDARHPLLGDACVPLDITFDPGVRLMVLSGPNTGGKTVLLKTLGLLAVMHQCSIPVPLGEESTLPVFSWFGVDIGDEQSIDEALSTFSAHLRTLEVITRCADGDSLILLDELGTGTDPEEGAALSLAIVDHLMNRGATVLVTTHQTVLKHYGYTRDGASNAAMAFDEEHHRPTYRVIPGRPGVSYAIDTAREQGLAPEIVERAQAYHQDRENSVAAIIARLLEEESRLNDDRAALREEREQIRREKAELQETRSRLTEQEEQLKRHGLVEIDRLLTDSRRRIEKEIRMLRERGVQLERAEIRALHESVQELEETRKRTQRELTERERVHPGLSRDTLVEGMSVQHRSTGRTGTVRSVRKEKVEVQFGALRMTVTPADLVEAEGPSPAVTSVKASSVSTELAGDDPERTPAYELDLRGCRLAEALEVLERQVDAAVLHNLTLFSVIHGTGTGVLQKGVQDYLRERREVRSVQFARPEDGGYGKTVVELTRESGVG